MKPDVLDCYSHLLYCVITNFNFYFIYANSFLLTTLQWTIVVPFVLSTASSIHVSIAALIYLVVFRRENVQCSFHLVCFLAGSLKLTSSSIANQSFLTSLQFYFLEKQAIKYPVCPVICTLSCTTAGHDPNFHNCSGGQGLNFWTFENLPSPTPSFYYFPAPARAVPHITAFCSSLLSR